jgi:hypothetical protein
MTEPLFEEVRAELAKEGERARLIAADFAAGVEAGAESVSHVAEAVFGHGRYHAGSVTENVPEEPAMSILTDFPAKAEDAARKFLATAQDDYNRAKALLEEELPAVSAEASKLASNPVVESLSKAAHLTEVPEALSAIASLIDSMEARLAAAEPAPAEAPAEAAEQPAEAPAA